MKRYVIGDIHGCHSELIALIEAIREHAKANNEDYKMIFVGDYVDRGPNSRGVVNLVMGLEKQGHVALMGNHEDMILAGDFSYAGATLSSFGSYLMELPDYVTTWFRSLPKYYEDEDIFVVHAGMKPLVDPKDQSDAMLLWYRYPRNTSANMGKHLYHGHTPTHGYIERASDRTNVDTACVYGGHLTAAVVGYDGQPEGFIQVPSKTNV